MSDGPGYKLEPGGASEEGKKQAQRERLLEAVLGADVTFWRDADGQAFARVPLPGGGIARYRVRSRTFALVIRRLYGEQNPRTVSGRGTIPGSVSDTAMQEVLPALEAIALSGVVLEAEVRAVRFGGAVWLDLGADDWRAVRVDAKGWKVVDQTDVPLIRPDGMRALPEPVRGKPGVALAKLREMLNLRATNEERDLKLVIAWLVAALYPTGPYAVLAADGEQGSGKTTFCKMLRRLVDRNKADLRAPPRSEDDLVVAATSARVVALDNVSFIEADMADGLCRLATGGGISKRRLYTDGEEHLVAVSRPVLLNGIPSLLARGDLADRALAITLPTIRDDTRRPEEAVWADFEAAAPSILAMLLDALAMAMRDMPSLKLARLPRMADFARLACAAAPTFGWTADDMLAALEGNRADAVEAVIEADVIAVAVRSLFAEPSAGNPYPRVTWEGTATLLLEELNRHVPIEAQRERGYPKDGARLSGRLKRLAPALRRAGVEIMLPTAGGRAGRAIVIKREDGQKQRSERSDASTEAKQRSGNASSVPERSAETEQYQSTIAGRNGGNAGNADLPYVGVL